VDSSGELDDYSPIIKKFRPVLLSVSGGEPLLRKNYDEMFRKLRPYCHYLAVITNGVLLNEKSAKRLLECGVNQICISLDYLGKRHDEARMVDGLYEHLSETIPMLSKQGFNIALNTIIMESNLDEILPIAYKAKEWGTQVSYSAYCSLKSDEDTEMIRNKRYTQLVSIVDEVRSLKRKLGNVKNSDYYLKRIPTYFRDGRVPNCRAGYRWVQVTPDGYVQQCSELPRMCHYSEFDRNKVKKATCAKCWYTCRGESEACPLEPRRLLELIRS